MNKKILSWFRVILILLSIIVFVSAAIILNSLKEDQPNLIHLFHSNIRNTVYIGTFLFFVLIATAYFYLPVHLKRSLGDISMILRDIQEGNYGVEIDLSEKKKMLDKSVFQIILQLYEVKSIVSKFDALKKKKIVEHYNRIVSLLRVVSEGVLILDAAGEIVFANDIVLETFPALEKNTNMLKNSYPPEIENNVKKLAQTSLQKKRRQEAQQCFIPNLKRHITLDSALVRDDAGDVIGVVLVMHNLEKRKTEKKEKDKEDEKSSS
jgi:signal transduction histidine kinase